MDGPAVPASMAERTWRAAPDATAVGRRFLVPLTPALHPPRRPVPAPSRCAGQGWLEEIGGGHWRSPFSSSGRPASVPAASPIARRPTRPPDVGRRALGHDWHDRGAAADRTRARAGSGGGQGARSRRRADRDRARASARASSTTSSGLILTAAHVVDGTSQRAASAWPTAPRCRARCSAPTTRPMSRWCASAGRRTCRSLRWPPACRSRSGRRRSPSAARSA